MILPPDCQGLVQCQENEVGSGPQGMAISGLVQAGRVPPTRQHPTLLEATQVRRTGCPEQSFTVFVLSELPNYSFQSSLDLALGWGKESPGT